MKKDNVLGVILRKAIRHNSGLALISGLIIAACATAALFPPLMLEKIVNFLTQRREIAFTLPLGYFGLLALSDLLESGQNVMITVFGQKITHSLRSELCAKLKRLPAAYFTRHTPAQITSRFVNDVDVVDSLFTNGIVGIVADALKIVGILLIIFYKSIGLGMFMLLVTPALFFMTRQFQKRILKAQLANRVAVSKVNNHIPETIHNIRTIHALFKQTYMEDKYDSYIEESYQALDKANLYDSIYSPIVIFISSCVISVLMVCAALGNGVQQFFGISVGTAVAIIAYVGKVFEPLESIGMEIQNIQSAVAGVKRINEFLLEPERTIPNDFPDTVASAAKKEPAIMFEHVEFGYDGETIVLQNMTFSVQQGESVTFNGRTGAGKSTLFKLILGMYDPQDGKVKICGIDAAKISDKEKRRLFGYVEQTFHPVVGTIADQISLLDESISRNEVKEAARLVGLHENIMEFEQGYDTPVEKLSFSQGQCQLLSIARAVAAQPKILLLDEITANMDSETQSRVLQALKRVCKGRTVLSISHRLNESTQSSRSIRIGD